MFMSKDPEYLAKWVIIVEGLPLLSGNALPYFNDTTFKFGNVNWDKNNSRLCSFDNEPVLKAFQKVFPGDYKLIWRVSDDVHPFSGVTIKFNKSEDEMWHRLKYE